MSRRQRSRRSRRRGGRRGSRNRGYGGGRGRGGRGCRPSLRQQLNPERLPLIPFEFIQAPFPERQNPNLMQQYARTVDRIAEINDNAINRILMHYQQQQQRQQQNRTRSRQRPRSQSLPGGRIPRGSRQPRCQSEGSKISEERLKSFRQQLQNRNLPPVPPMPLDDIGKIDIHGAISGLGWQPGRIPKALRNGAQSQSAPTTPTRQQPQQLPQQSASAPTTPTSTSPSRPPPFLPKPMIPSPIKGASSVDGASSLSTLPRDPPPYSAPSPGMGTVPPPSGPPPSYTPPTDPPPPYTPRPAAPPSYLEAAGGEQQESPKK